MVIARRVHGAAPTVTAAFIALVAVALAQAVPALAGHTTCTTGAEPYQALRTTDCPEMSPDFTPFIEVPYVDSPSGITYRYGQADHESAIVRAEYFVPRGWQFAVESIRAGEAPPPAPGSPGPPATQCAQVYDRPSPSASLVAKRAEVLSKDVGMRTLVNPRPSERVYGIGKSRNAQPAPPEGRASLSFLRWLPPAGGAPGVAELCLYLSTAAVAAAQPDFEFIVPIRLVKIPSGDPGARYWSWRIEMGMDGIIRNSSSLSKAASVVYNGLNINSVTQGNWHRNPVTGFQQPLQFSSAPREPIAGRMRAAFTTCRVGLNPAADPEPCRDGDRLTLSEEHLINISPGPASGTHDFAKLDGPYGLEDVGSGYGPGAVGGYGFVRGTDTAEVVWYPPPLGPDDTVKGYVLVVAEPGDQDTRHFDYIVTQKYLVDSFNETVLDAGGNPVVNPSFDTREICGPEGLDECLFSLQFPLSTPFGRILDGNAKYNLALITVYADGHRTDRLCDNGTAQGAPCDPRLPAFNVRAPGVSTWQFLMRTKAWPNAFLETYSITTPATVGPDGSVQEPQTSRYPRFLLLADFALREAEFYVWGANIAKAVGVPSVQRYEVVGNAQDGKGQSFAGASTGILGAGDQGLISFGNFKPDGAVASFRFDGVATSIGISGAFGNFTLYDPHNWTLGEPRLDPTNPYPRHPCINLTTSGACNPSATAHPFVGVRLA